MIDLAESRLQGTLQLSDSARICALERVGPIAGDLRLTALQPGFDQATLVCKAALHAFTAENEARMEAMTSAGSQITKELELFEATLRRVRQEDITAEIVELGTGVASTSDVK